MVVGIAGRYCAGKDTVAEYLANQGFDVIDVDKTGHKSLEELAGRIATAFGPEVLAADGSIDRKALGGIVFRSSIERKRLESILHPAMVAKVESLLEGASGRAVINAAILFRMGLHRLCDVVIVVSAPFWMRLRRALHRDRLSLQDTFVRMVGQGRILVNKKTEPVDIYRIRNTGNLTALKTRVDSFLVASGVHTEGTS